MRFAINPLQWLATDDGWLDFNKALPLPDLLQRVAQAGFTAIQCDLPAGMSTNEYAASLAEHGLDPAPGYYSMPLDDADERPRFLRETERMSSIQADLGISELFVASNMDTNAVRVKAPARGVEADPARLERIAQSLELVGEATRRYGVTACLHPHVGTWIEVEEEIDWLLERLDPAIVALGPDTGHLAWAGADPLAVVRKYRQRIRAIHVKDIRLGVAGRHRNDHADYKQVIQDGLWVEPGRGDLDFTAILAELADDVCTWAIVEVDRPDLPTPEASVAASAKWAAGRASDRPRAAYRP